MTMEERDMLLYRLREQETVRKIERERDGSVKREREREREREDA